MSRAAVFVFASAFVLAAPHAAQAADPIGFPPPPPLVEKETLFVQEYRSGWYLRGDIGYRMSEVGSVEATLAPFPVSFSELEDNFTFGGGGGYKSGWFRADATIDWSPGSSFSASTPFAADDYRMKIESVTLLGNMYFDLGTWSGFTPYVGAGLGAAMLRITDYLGVSYPVATYQRENNWNFAWALTGGFSYALSPGLLLDANYRYLDMGEVQTSVLSPLGNQFTAKDITAHEFRVGLRYNID